MFYALKRSRAVNCILSAEGRQSAIETVSMSVRVLGQSSLLIGPLFTGIHFKSSLVDFSNNNFVLSNYVRNN